MDLQPCVLLRAEPGQEAALTEYENTVLALVSKRGGRVVGRVRRADGAPGPLDVQVIHLPDEAALRSYMQDPVRVALAEMPLRGCPDRAVAPVSGAGGPKPSAACGEL